MWRWVLYCHSSGCRVGGWRVADLWWCLDLFSSIFSFSLITNNILRVPARENISFQTAPIDDTIFGMTTQWIFVITICTLLMMLACGVGLSICICRRNSNQNVNHKSQMAMTTSDVNGQKHLNFYRPAVLGEFFSWEEAWMWA